MYFVIECCEQENTLLNKYKPLKMILSHFKKMFYDQYILALRDISRKLKGQIIIRY